MAEGWVQKRGNRGDRGFKGFKDPKILILPEDPEDPETTEATETTGTTETTGNLAFISDKKRIEQDECKGVRMTLSSFWLGCYLTFESGKKRKVRGAFCRHSLFCVFFGGGTI